jgi:hypothetical protein
VSSTGPAAVGFAKSATGLAPAGQETKAIAAIVRWTGQMEITRYPYTLEPGEQVLWHGGTRESRWWRILPMASALLIAAIPVVDTHAPMPFRMVCLTLAGISLLLLIWMLSPRGRILTWRKEWMYRVTNRSVVVQGPGKGIFSIVDRVPLSDIGDLDVSTDPNGLGTVVIGYAKEAQTLSDGTRVFGALVYLKLDRIANPREVYRLIESARQNAASSPAEAAR